MWAYKDENGNSHTNLDLEQVREAIEQKKIKADTPIRNSKIAQEWILAKNTSFFSSRDQNKPATNLPETKSGTEFRPQLPSPGQQASPSHKKQRKGSLILFGCISGFAILVMATLSGFLISHNQKINQFQSKVDEHNLEMEKKEISSKNLKTIEAKIFDFKFGLHANSKLSSSGQEQLKELNQERLKLKSELAQFELIPTTSPFAIKVKLQEQEIQRYLILAPFAASSITLPFLFAIFHFFKSCKLIHHKFWILPFLLHSTPGIHFLMYAYIASRWNLEGAQRKNNFLLTFPLSLLALGCLGLACYHFWHNDYNWVTVLTATLPLWVILHLRQLQMLAYAASRKN